VKGKDEIREAFGEAVQPWTFTGSPKEEVIKAYADYKTEKEQAGHLSESGDKHLVGSIYGGMIFDFEEGNVSRIFLGASAA